MAREKVHLSIRMDTDLRDKFHYVAGADGRSMSAQVLYMIRKYVRDFEKENGPITEEDLKEDM
ncbi:MAG: hypothetical protein IJB75_02275 [Oscillospiraceae bacterium]|nr:hypothetical protein [Oscillospiraceae bacterium]MBQ7088467.1 hypothetical protein [Clostridia bacterium]